MRAHSCISYMFLWWCVCLYAKCIQRDDNIDSRRRCFMAHMLNEKPHRRRLGRNFASRPKTQSSGSKFLCTQPWNVCELRVFFGCDHLTANFILCAFTTAYTQDKLTYSPTNSRIITVLKARARRVKNA